jgi:hypothetical protein
MARHSRIHVLANILPFQVSTWLADLLPSHLGHSSSLTVDDQGQTLDSEGMAQGNSAWLALREPTAFAKAGIIYSSADL